MSDCSTHAYDVPMKGTLTADHVKRIHEIIEKHWHDLPAEYDMPEATALPEYSYDWQAIADELNSRAERTCKPLGTIRYDYEGGYAGFEYETELSCGHKWCDSYGDYPNYCPNCGAPKHGAVCEYCGTHFAHYQGQAIVEVEQDFVDIRTWDGATFYRIYNAPNVTVKVVNE